MNIPAIGSLYYSANPAGGDVQQNLNNLRSRRDELQSQLESGAVEVQEQISNLDKQINTLEKRVNKATGKEECQTCKNRTYKDGSDDPGVSFKTAGKINPGNVASTVRGHEQEHVVRERAKAEREDKNVVSQSVRIKSDICPECGKSYVSGGETVTVTKSKPENPFNVGIAQQAMASGSLLNTQI
ncbi:MAG: hypothetical protein E7508_03590 [Ruminococcus sp.]|nr:hypothetical protein [Ruminococcus sp.]